MQGHRWICGELANQAGKVSIWSITTGGKINISSPILVMMIFLVFLSHGCGSNSTTPKADTIFTGGPIVTVNPDMPEAQAIAVKDGLIMAVGDEKTIKDSTLGARTKIVDLAGHTLMPGFVEPHVHIVGTAVQTILTPYLSNWTANYDTLDQIVQKLKALLPNVPPGGWLTGFGVDPSRTTPFMAALDANTLDQVSATVPIFILNQSGHIAYVNHKAFELAGITNSTPDPEGGKYVKDANGNLTGELQELSSFVAFQAKMPLPSQNDIAAALKKLSKQLAAKGITTSAEISLGPTLGFDLERNLLQGLAADPTTPIRIRAYLYGPSIPTPNPVTLNQGDDRLRYVGVKYVADGSTQGLTAALNQPYTYPAGTSNTGSLDYPDTAAFLSQVKKYFDTGWQVSIHANGDRTINQVLGIYSQLLAGNPHPETRRLRIEHFTVTTDAQCDLVKQLGITPSMTIGHVFFWGAAFNNQIIGPARAQRIDPTGSLRQRGVRFAFHSDSPVSPFEPLRYITNGVPRLWQASPQQVLGPDQRISVDEAIRAVTLDAAYQLFSDDKLGSLEVGKLADFVVLEKNPRTTDPNDIINIKVLETYLSGVKQSW
ncbi:MAG: amidohydrolase [Deltaproteobacteria bacterium]|nr:amidohydrolase [Deltaproteobacteria bacterium]